jgi:hypothetical protein
MPGLISESQYIASADALRAAVPGVGDAIEAAEWELLHATDLKRYPFITLVAGEAVRYCVTNASDWAPSIVIVFTQEFFNGIELKVVLLDVKLAESDDEQE